MKAKEIRIRDTDIRPDYEKNDVVIDWRETPVKLVIDYGKGFHDTCYLDIEEDKITLITKKRSFSYKYNEEGKTESKIKIKGEVTN